MSGKNLKSFYDTGWRILIILAVLLQAGIMPLDFLFNLRSEFWYRAIDLSVSLIFLLDLLENLYRYRRIQNHTVFKDIYWDTYSSKSYFIADILAIVPYAFVFSNPFWQLFRLLKWVKVFRTVRFFQIRNLRSSSLISFWLLIIGFFVLSHWFSCLWMAFHGFDSLQSNTDNYIQSLYWVITTLTSVGYGDITPSGNSEMLFAIFLQIIGVGVLAFLVGSVVGIFTKKNPAEQRFIENMEKLRALIHYHNIPKSLENRISDYFTYEWKQKLGYDESDLMDVLPFALKNELQFEFKKNAIKEIPLFDCVDDQFIREIAHYLRPTVLTPGDYLFRAGDEANSMFFVQRGKIKVLSADESKHLTLLRTGDFFGEIALFRATSRTATVKAIGFADLYELQKKEFDTVLEKYPKIATKIKEKSLSREERYI